MINLTERQVATLLKYTSEYNHYIQACTDIINGCVNNTDVINFDIFNSLLYKMIEILAQKYVYLRDNRLLGCKYIDFKRYVAGDKKECLSYPIINSMDNYNDVVVKMYPDFNGESCMNITFQVTEDCNLNCTYCYQHNKSHRVLQLEDAKTFIDQILTEDPKITGYMKASEYKACVIDFIGGEPFLEVDLMENIIQYFVKRLFELNHPWLTTYMISISSNGILYNSERTQNFIRKHNKVLSLSITVDGTKELHDKCRLFPDGSPSYDIAHAASLAEKRNNGSDASKITLAPDNIMYFADCIMQMLADNFATIHANFVYEEGWTKEHARIYYNQVKQLTTTIIDKGLYGFDCDIIAGECGPMDEKETGNWCGGTGHMMCLSPNGRIYPCLRYAPSSVGSDDIAYDIGSVDKGIGTTHHWNKRIHTLRKITRQSQSSDECLNCPVAKGCGWCSGYNYERFGTPDKRATFICCMHKARALASVFYNNMQYKSGHTDAVFDIRLPQEECISLIGEGNYRELVDLTLNIGGKVCGL